MGPAGGSCLAWAGNQVELLLGGSGSLSGGATVKSEMSQEGAGVLPPPPDQVISVHQSWKTWKEQPKSAFTNTWNKVDKYM